MSIVIDVLALIGLVTVVVSTYYLVVAVCMLRSSSSK